MNLNKQHSLILKAFNTKMYHNIYTRIQVLKKSLEFKMWGLPKYITINLLLLIWFTDVLK